MKQTDSTDNLPPQLRLFVYGTLRPGNRNHRRFCNGALSIENAFVRGRLYELPSGIPILDVPVEDIIAVGTADIAHDLLAPQDTIPAPEDSPDHGTGWLAIRGELMTFDEPASRLHTLDFLEGFFPDSCTLYRRVLLPIYRQDGEIIAAWCYVLGARNVRLQALGISEWRELF